MKTEMENETMELSEGERDIIVHIIRNKLTEFAVRSMGDPATARMFLLYCGDTIGREYDLTDPQRTLANILVKEATLLSWINGGEQ